MKIRSIFWCLAALISPGPLSGQTPPLPPEAKGLFDFDDVPQADREKAKEEMVQQELEADASLPQNVRDVLDRMTQYQLIQDEIVQRNVQPLRTRLKERLTALEAGTAGEEKLSVLALEKYVDGLSPTDSLSVSGASADPAAMDSWVDVKGKPWNTFLSNSRIKRHRSDGRWCWLNRQRTLLLVDYWGGSVADVVILSSPMATEAEVFNSSGDRRKIRRNPRPPSSAKKASAAGLKLIQESAAAEQALREKAAADVMARKASVAKWITAQANTAAPDVAPKILSEAAALTLPSGAAGGKTRSRAHLFAGTWLMQDKRRMELKEDGAVLINAKPAGASWNWCKDRNATTALVKFGNPDSPSEVWLIRRSSQEQGVIRVATRSSYTTAKKE